MPITKNKRSVSFDRIDIREYQRTVGDNPSVSSGPALSLAWDYSDSVRSTVDNYESERGSRRKMMEMVVPRFERELLLKDSGVSRKEMAQCVRTINHIKAKRRQTVNNLKMSKMEENWEGVTRTMGKIMKRRNRLDTDLLYSRESDDLQATRRSSRISRRSAEL